MDKRERKTVEATTETSPVDERARRSRIYTVDKTTMDSLLRLEKRRQLLKDRPTGLSFMMDNYVLLTFCDYILCSLVVT